ncbi:MAG TPA: glycoside hydrolase family 30 beta sandwich domain-containing protein [Terracidiphilus sp.]|jgi:glucosylceramidase|nr:glycoside hydrolase family 30 beta sandwich domain-containing protein [Terracidiphilus sp.]
MLRKLGSIVAVSSSLPICAIAVVLIGGLSNVSAQTVQVLQTNGDQSLLLATQPSVTFGSKTSNRTSITVNDGTKYQTMDGFGAAFTDSSTYLIYNKLTSTQRSSLMTSLFSTASGAGMSMMRLPMGATDFAVSGNYTYDDTSNCAPDTSLTNFSIAHDTTYTIPVIQQALSLYPSMKIEALPWSPPAWMKTTCTMNGGNFNMNYLTPLANYFVKFVQGYKSYNIPITYLAVQNEPLNSTTSYPSESLADTDEANIIANDLGPALQTNGLSAQIITYDHNWNNYSYPENVLSNSAAYANTVGSSFHCYSGTPSDQNYVEKAYPAKGIWFTECSGSVGSKFQNDLVWNEQNLFIGAVRDYAKSVLLWNLALDQNSGPKNGGCTNCRGVVTINDSTSPATIAYNVEYYVIGQSAKWVQQGAYRIDSNNPSNSLIDVAFLNPDGTHVLVVCNTASSTSSTFEVVYNNSGFTYTLPHQSVVTFKW